MKKVAGWILVKKKLFITYTFCLLNTGSRNRKDNTRKNEEQAGAELCQAQEQLGLAKLAYRWYSSI